MQTGPSLAEQRFETTSILEVLKKSMEGDIGRFEVRTGN